MKKFLKKFVSKDDYEELSYEDKEKLDSMLGDKEQNSKEQNDNKIDLKDFVSKLNLEQIDELRELLNKREETLHEIYGLKDSREYKSNSNYSGEINVEERVSDKDLDTKTYEEEHEQEKTDVDETLEKEEETIESPEDKKEEKIDLEEESKVSVNSIYDKDESIKDNNYDEEYFEIDDDIEIDDESLENDFDENDDDLSLKLKQIFGEKNVFIERKKNFHEKLPKDKKIICIGIRKKDAFNNEDINSQNSWFIGNIKKLEELPNFKMVNSNNSSKELFWDREKNPIFISFKSTEVLKSPDEFNF